MRTKGEYVALFSEFPRPSGAEREALVQALAEMLVLDYQQNQVVTEPSVKSWRGLNRGSGDETASFHEADRSGT